MRLVTLEIEGLTPYSQSRALQSTKEKDEEHNTFDSRIWPEHIHADEDGNVVIPAVAILQGLAKAASYLGKGGALKKKANATWAENFRCGLAIARSPALDTKQKARPERCYCHANGQRSSGTRVWRTFPIWDDWKATVLVHILDDSIPEDIFGKVAEAAGLFIGIGRYRPENGGYLGRFTVKKATISTV